MNDLVYEAGPRRVTIAPYAPGDEDGIRELFRLVFGRERSAEEWRWLFSDCPDGFHCFLGRDDDDRIVSQFCAIPARLMIRGSQWVVGQIVDSMVHPEYRAGLKHRGLFAVTVDAMVEAYGRPDRELMMVGLPNRPAFRIGRKLCGYVPMNKVHVHTKLIEPRAALPEIPLEVTRRGRTFRIQKVHSFSADIDVMWQRLAPRYDAISLRDRARLEWRYAQCTTPEHYHILEMRRPDGLLVGYAVGVFGYQERPDGIIADWFVDEDEPEAAEALLGVVENLMSSVSMTQVKCLLNPNCRESRFFEDMGYDLTTTHYHLVSRTYAPDVVTPEWLNRYWYYTLGDFDVV